MDAKELQLTEKLELGLDSCESTPGVKRLAVIAAAGAKSNQVARECRAIRAQTIEYTNANIKQRIGLLRYGVETIRRARSYLALTLFALRLFEYF